VPGARQRRLRRPYLVKRIASRALRRRTATSSAFASNSASSTASDIDRCVPRRRRHRARIAASSTSPARAVWPEDQRGIAPATTFAELPEPLISHGSIAAAAGKGYARSPCHPHLCGRTAFVARATSFRHPAYRPPPPGPAHSSRTARSTRGVISPREWATLISALS
jgi:hypothetical protein